ncbi:MAG: N-formylglutamate amidohydrolase, partial [Candidatus Cloacimonadaceae bacterium]|nr:N-formylglutamate amidohydrolase [Candidatus Cloacimonadaceae bacterium]
MIKSKFCIGNPELPLMALAIHNGHDMPRELMDICGISDTERLQEEDPYTALISEKCGNYITVLSSRFMVDLNRSPQKAVYQKPEDCWGLPVRKSEIPGDYLAKLYQAYDQWYALLGYNIEKLLQRHEHLIVLDIHSYNHRRGGTTAPPDPQIDNPDLILGRSNMPMEHYPAVAKLRHRLHGKMLGNRVLDCREDIKFTGGNLSRYLHDKYDGKVMSISIEFKKIFMDEWTGLLDEVIFGEFIALFWDSIK